VVVTVSVVDTVTGIAGTMVGFAELIPGICPVPAADAVAAPVDRVAVLAAPVPMD
jgi:hypothetical protein